MNAKLIAAVFAALIASAAQAEQQFGRDSVTIGKNAPSKAPSNAKITRHGRDSVYIGNSAPLRQPSTMTTESPSKPGRA